MSTITSAQPNRIPSYCRQKLKGRSPLAYVDLPTGNAAKPIKRFYLGVHKSADSRAKYETTIGQWLARGRTWPLDGTEAGLPPTDRRSVAYIVADYLTWASQQYLRKDGRHGTRFRDTKSAVKPLCALFANKPAAEFTPMDLETIQTGMVKGGKLCRKTIKERIDIIKRVFRRAGARALIPAPVSGALECADALPTHHPDVRESRVVKPVAQHLVDAVRPLVSRQVRALIDLQSITGARPGELFNLTMADLDTSGEKWKYEPKEHKTAHHGCHRRIYFPKDAQAILKEFMTTDRPLNAPLFSPKEADAERRAARHQQRLKDENGTPLSCGNRPGTNRKENPLRQPGDKFTDSAYSSAVERACLKAFPPPAELARLLVAGKRGHKRWETPEEWRKRLGDDKWAQLQAWIKQHHWFPYQLRHKAATEFRKKHGLEKTRILLGHSSATITEGYAEADWQQIEAVI